jgi:hypothetical protein
MEATTKKELQHIEEMTPAARREDTKKKAEKYKEAWVSVAKNLYVIKGCKDYEKWGHDTFIDYVEKELGIEERTVFYWFSIIDKFYKEGIPEAEWREVDWTKLRMIIPVVNKANHKKLIADARDKSRPQLMHQVKCIKEGKKDEDGPVMEMLTFSVTLDEKKIIQKALEAASKIAQNDRPAHLLEMICMHFLADAPETRKEEFLKLISKIEEKFFIKTVVISKDNPGWKEMFEKARDIVRGALVESKTTG